MPNVDGYEFMRQLRARPANLGGLIPALALTAYARAADRDEALGAGYQAHVAKPVDPVDLVRAITELTGRPIAPPDAQI
jgi:CheY-like chemotaxis protein